MSNREPNFGGGPGGPGGGGGFQGGYPMFGGMPIIIRDQLQQQQPRQPGEPPLRAQMALAINSHLTRKQMPQVAVTETQIEIIPGQKLTDEEAGAQATAMNAMAHYLAGTLVPDVWERQNLSSDNGIPTLEFRCICKRADAIPNPDCPFCAGEGIMDVVVKNPRRATSDGDGNITVQGTASRTKMTSGIPTEATPVPGPQTGKRRRPPQNENEANET